MTTPRFTLDDLRRILLDGAGAGEDVELGADILDAPFDELGYESLALLETSGRIEREYEITLDDDAVTGVVTPRALIDVVNTHLGDARAVS